MNRALKHIDLAVVLQHQESQDNGIPYLDKERATELLQKIGQNIANHYPQITQSGMIGIGSTYHLNQIIRPNFPIYTQLFELAKLRFRPNNFKPNIVGLGTHESQFEIDIFNRESSQFAEVLQVLPFSIILPESEETSDFFNELEDNLITQLHLDSTLQQEMATLFNLSIENLSIVTLSDLNGLFAAQLIQIGLEELWEIIKAVIFNLDEIIVTLGSGHILYWKLDEVAIITAHESIYDDVMSDYLQSYQRYSTTTKRLEALFHAHKIPYIKRDVMDRDYFATDATIDSTKAILNAHIQAL